MLEYLKTLMPLLVIAVPAIGGAIWLVIKPKLVTDYARIYKQVALIYQVMTALCNQHLNINRILILQTKNGGGRPRLGSRLKSSIIYEQTKIEPVMSGWQDVFVDESYIRMMMDALTAEDQTLLIRAKDVQNNQLKNAYEKSGITYILIFIIGEKHNRFFYSSIQFKRKPTKAMMADAEAFAREIRSIFNARHSNI